ncbi:MAG: 50S ribosomal protein L13 [Chitinivibrionales bacterium]|nr:50S ribosomal protein L13 [Chitinivibrionales bacterium]
MKTTVMNHKEIARKWYLVDAENKILGRLASEIAKKLIGKNKPFYSPNQDHGDNVVVINSDKVALSGRKPETKSYFRHSQYPGGEKIRPYRKQMELDSTRVIVNAVKGMVPKNTLGRAIMKKLHVYAGSEHPHEAQKPEPLSIGKSV